MENPAEGRTRLLLAGGVVGPPLFVLVFLVEGLLHPPGYDPVRHTVSGFVLGDLGWVQRANFLVSGALVLAFAFGLRTALAGCRGRRWAVVLVGLVGVGLVGAGIFAADPVAAGSTAAVPYPPGAPPGDGRTAHGVLHDLFGVPVFLGLPVACLVLGFAAAGRRMWAAYSVGTGVVLLAGFVLTSAALAQPPLIVPIGGLLQRITLAVGFGWLTVLAVLLLSRRPRGSRRSGRAASGARDRGPGRRARP